MERKSITDLTRENEARAIRDWYEEREKPWHANQNTLLAVIVAVVAVVLLLFSSAQSSCPYSAEICADLHSGGGGKVD